MDFQLRCSCGQDVSVTEGSAGAVVACACGRAIDVPGLKELRSQAGLAPYDPSPELVLESLLARGALPEERVCVECGVTTDGVVHVRVECERAWRKRSGAFGGRMWFLLLFVPFIFVPIAIYLLWRADEGREVAREKAYVLPLRLCPMCALGLKGKAAIKALLGRVAVYRRLLDKFPGALVALVSKESCYDNIRRVAHYYLRSLRWKFSGSSSSGSWRAGWPASS